MHRQILKNVEKCSLSWELLDLLLASTFLTFHMSLPRFCCIEQQISELRALIDARPRLDAEARARALWPFFQGQF